MPVAFRSAWQISNLKNHWIQVIFQWSSKQTKTKINKQTEITFDRQKLLSIQNFTEVKQTWFCRLFCFVRCLYYCFCIGKRRILSPLHQKIHRQYNDFPGRFYLWIGNTGTFPWGDKVTLDRWHTQLYASRMTLELKKYKPYLNQSKTESFNGLKQNI